jgi:hypothetical protein
MPKKLSYDYVKEQIEKEGFELVSKEYINANSKLKTNCPEGHEHNITFGNWKAGYRCPECAGNKKLTYEPVKEQIENEGYKLLSKEYKNAFTKLKVKCPVGHEYKVTWNCFQQGKRCPECVGGVKLSYDYVKEYIEKEGFELVSDEYKNKETYLLIKCSKGHVVSRKWYVFQQNPICPECVFNEKVSKPENILFDFVNNIYTNKIIQNDRSQIINPLTSCNLELDIWLPELNKAIEFNGRYWHTLPEVVQRDYIKYQQCREKGIDLLVINEENWINNREGCLQKVKEFIL